MSEWIGPLVYGIGYVACLRPIVRWFVYDTTGPPEGDDIVAGIFFGGLATLLWPIIAPFMLIKRALEATGGSANRVALSVIGESRQQKIERLEREAAERERHVAELERSIKTLDREIERAAQ